MSLLQEFLVEARVLTHTLSDLSELLRVEKCSQLRVDCTRTTATASHVGLGHHTATSNSTLSLSMTMALTTRTGAAGLSQ